MSSLIETYCLGALAGMTATLLTHPLEFIKIRLQVTGMEHTKQYNGICDCMKTVIKEEGLFALYCGLSAALLHQITYTGVRFVVYKFLVTWYFEKYGELTYYSRLLMAMFAGGTALISGAPTEIAIVRLIADGSLPPNERRYYTGVFNALIRMTREEGFLVLWRGFVPTVIRRVSGNMTGLGSYSQVKSMLVKEKWDDLNVYIVASLAAATVSTIFVMPIDIIKTRIQNMKVVNNEPEYTGLYDVLTKIIRNEGFFALWKGIRAFFLRCLTLALMTFNCFEWYCKIYNAVVWEIDADSGI